MRGLNFKRCLVVTRSQSARPHLSESPASLCTSRFGLTCLPSMLEQPQCRRGRLRLGIALDPVYAASVSSTRFLATAFSFRMRVRQSSDYAALVLVRQ